MRRWVLRLVVCIAAAVANCAAALSHVPDRTYHFAAKVPGQPSVRLYIEETGQGRPMLLLHGFAASTYTWRRVVPALSKRHRVIALDLKGFGKSDKPFDRAYRPEDHANLVADFITRRGLRNAIVTGHSYGGMVGLLATMKLNARRQDRVSRMILMNAPAFRQPITNFLRFMNAPVMPYAVLSLIPPEITTWLVLDPMQRQISTLHDVRRFAAPYYSAAARHAAITTARQVVPENVDYIVGRYRNVRQKTLVVWCDADKTVPLATGRRLSRALPNARLEVIKGCEHVPQDERPNRLLAAFARFLRN